MSRKLVWITGASGGIGQALSQTYNKNGYFVILSGRNAQKLKDVQQQLIHPEACAIAPFDVNDFDAAKKTTQQILATHGCPNVIILNAGISQRSLAIDTDFEVTASILKTNFLSNINIVKPIIPDLQKSKSHLVVISSVTGKLGTPMRSSYAASKHALHGYFDSLRAELYESGAKVTIVCPGYISTNISINALVGDGSKQNSMDKDTKNGLKPSYLAQKIYSAQQKNKYEIYVGRKEIIAIYLKRFFPTILHNIIRNIKPK